MSDQKTLRIEAVKKKIHMIKQETDAWVSWMLTACSGHNQVREECLLLIKQLIDVEKTLRK